jgi:hypothetical protein
MVSSASLAGPFGAIGDARTGGSGGRV